MVVPRNIPAGARLGSLFQKCPIPAGVCFTFSKSAQFPAGLGLLLQKLREPGCVSNEWRPTPVRYELHFPLAGKDLSEVFGGDVGSDSAVVSHADRAALFGDDDDDGVRLLRHAQSGAVAQAHLLG